MEEGFTRVEHLGGGLHYDGIGGYYGVGAHELLLTRGALRIQSQRSPELPLKRGS
jgi:hypothetical protein